MTNTTGIEWTDVVWNPVTGCHKVSEGCRNCYAATFAGRGIGSFTGGRKFTDVRTHADRLNAPLKWRKPRRVFVNSMSDLFHDDVPVEFIDDVFATILAAGLHTFQILTKRPRRMLAYMRERMHAIDDPHGEVGQRLFDLRAAIDGVRHWPPLNCWLGVSCENQAAADERIPLLLQTPAAVRFLSCEPLLEPIDIGLQSATCKCCDRWPSRWVRLHRPVGPDMPELIGTKSGTWIADCGIYRARSNPHGALSVQTPGGLLGIKPTEFDCLPGIDWVIAGGESDPGARPCDVAWIRSIVEQCKAAGVVCFVKQLGAYPLADSRNVVGFRWSMLDASDHGHGDKHVRIRLRDRKGSDPAEWPEDLRVREFPTEEER